MKALVIMNRRAGTGRRRFGPEEVAAAFRRHGVEPDVREVEGEEIEATVAGAAGVDVVVSAGGDGTLLTVAGGLLRRGSPTVAATDVTATGGKDPAGGILPLGILPAGTVNHLARNAGIPLDLDGAARTIAGGRMVEIDAAEVNGRLFLTDTMIGLLTWVLFAVERRRGSVAERIWVLLSMLVRVLLRLPLVAMEVRAGDRVIRASAPMLLITNNRMALEGRNFLDREVLDGGRLCLYLPKTTRRSTLLRLFFQAFAGRLDLARELEIVEEESVEVILRRKSPIMAMIDGEFAPLRSPLRVRILPRALRLCVP